MTSNRRQLILDQLTENIINFKTLGDARIPAKGWIRAIREALGMSGVQFAERLGVSPARVTVLEQAERSGAVTIKSIRQAAEALDCVFVHALVPRTSLKDTIRRQARNVARARLARSSHTMLLENQRLSNEEMRKALDDAVEELVRTMPRDFWKKAE